MRDDRLLELKELLRGKTIRFLLEDVVKDLPEITRKEVRLNLKVPTKEQDALADAFDKYMSGSKADPTAKAASALLKAPLTVEYCQMLQVEGSGPLLIYTDHVESAKHIAIGLGAKLITGATPMTERQNAVESFQSNHVQYLVATIGALSVGVTLTAARHVVFNDLSWTPADNLQAEKRIHRIGQKNACVSHWLDATPTDKIIRETLFAKLETIAKVMA